MQSWILARHYAVVAGVSMESKGRVLALWRELAGAPPTALATAGHIALVESAESRMCPAGWVGVVTLYGSAVIVVPTARVRELVEDALDAVGPPMLANPEALLTRLPEPRDIRGPAALLYADDSVLPDTPAPDPGVSVSVHAGTNDPAIAAFLWRASSEDRQESGLEEVTSRIFAVRHGDEVVAACGYRPWLQTVAHMSVLTDAHRRGGGLAQQVALVASRDAVGHRLVAQWRARPPQSRRVAEKLGYEAAGSQLSLRLPAAG